MGKILEFSDDHSSLGENVRHLSTIYISPQFYSVCNDLFEMVISTIYYDGVLNAICNDMFELNRDCYVNIEHYETGNLI